MGSKNTPIAIAVIVILVVLTGVGMWASAEPDMMDVQALAQEKVGDETLASGVVTANTLVEVTRKLLDKNGGYLSNDIAPPFVMLDNMPSWEFGVLVQVRDLARALRRDISRAQSTSSEDPNLAKAEPLLHFDNKSFMFPSTEGEYEHGIKELSFYVKRLQAGEAHFSSRADNLRTWLQDVETRLGSVSKRLSASVANNIAIDPVSGEVQQTPWMQIDNVFYEARGTCWALAHFLHAIEYDFNQVLKDKEVHEAMQEIVRELEATQQPVYSPLILNGDGLGVLANHSLVLANYISRANTGIKELIDRLAKG